MLNTAICDDNSSMADYLRGLIADAYSANALNSEIECFSSAEEFLGKYTQTPFDIVFLDIVMPEINGFEAARLIRKISPKTYIIFITTESGLVYDSFDFQPFYFIPKSKREITESKIKDVIKKLAVHISADEKVEISAAYGNKIFMPPQNILYLKSSLNNVEYHLADKTTQTVRAKLADIVPGLNTYVFAQPHNRYVVNMRHIEFIDYPNMEILLDNGETLPISRSAKKDFDSAYIRFERSFN